MDGLFWFRVWLNVQDMPRQTVRAWRRHCQQNFFRVDSLVSTCGRSQQTTVLSVQLSSAQSYSVQLNFNSNCSASITIETQVMTASC